MADFIAYFCANATGAINIHAMQLDPGVRQRSDFLVRYILRLILENCNVFEMFKVVIAVTRLMGIPSLRCLKLLQIYKKKNKTKKNSENPSKTIEYISKGNSLCE